MKKTSPQRSKKAQSLKLGQYEHYKGNRYQLISTAFHSETLKEYVVYQALYGNKEIWIRPLEMFCEMVKLEGDHEVPRFRYIVPKEEAETFN